MRAPFVTALILLILFMATVEMMGLGYLGAELPQW